MAVLTIQQERQRIQQLINLDNQTDRQSSQYYRECLMYIRDHLSQFYAQYATDNGLTISQVSSRASRWDLQQWQNAVKQTDMADWPSEAFARVKALNAQIHVDKAHVIAALIGLAVIGMTVKNQRTIERRIELDASAEVKRMQNAFDLSQTRVKRVESVITQARRESRWSANLWLDSDSLANDVETLVNKHLKHGMSLQNMENMLADHTNQGQFKPTQSVADRVKQMEFNTRRIVRTESSRLIDEVNMTSYRMDGINYIEWVNEPGACQLCQGLSDGSPYAIDDAPDIPDDSHPNCRCHKTPASNPNYVNFNNF